MSACKSCDDGLPLYAMDDNGTSVRVEGAGPLEVIGHSVDDSHWPCFLVPQPNAASERWRGRMLRAMRKDVPA